MKTVAAFLLICVLVIEIRAQARDPRERCLCTDAGLNWIPRDRIKKVEILPPSPSCSKQEIIVTLKNDAGKKCLNPESKFVQNLLKRLTEKKSHQ